MTDVSVELVDAELTLPLRQRVLRPHQTIDTVLMPGELAPGAAHVAARTADGTVVASAVLLREPFPLLADHTPAWRLRGMATDEQVRNRGIGRMLLTYVIDHVARHGGGLLWCHARLPARAFYERAGFVAIGDSWEDPQIGPHIAMWREVSASE